MPLLIVVLGIALLLLPILPFKSNALLAFVDVAGPIASRGLRKVGVGPPAESAGTCSRRRGGQGVSA